MQEGVFVFVIGDVYPVSGQIFARLIMALGGAAGSRNILVVVGGCRRIPAFNEVHALAFDYMAIQAVRRLVRAKFDRLVMEGFLIGIDHIVKIVALL